ncbi:MAG: LysR family transcriptional regulator [Yoonia sp.]|uniref:LysR family transcriptional regulator n=1 Tax=Yoonia sp. TaxID=2212373 RepID=UPI00326516DE
MDDTLQPLDWSLAQAFLAVAETGSLSAAARKLGTTQPTIGRQIKAMEWQLGAELFHRAPRGLSLTHTGTQLVEPAQAMRDAVNQMTLTAAGQSASLKGTVRITASVATSVYHLPQIISDIRAAEPDIEIELVASDESRNLLFREADIAVRMYRPTQEDLITQHIGEIALGVFASRSYLKRKGGLDDPAQIAEHDVVGYDADKSIIDGMRDAGVPVDRHFFKVRCDDNIAYWNLVRAGCGVGFAQKTLGLDDPEIVEIDLGFPLPTLPVWLTAHEAMRRTPRIRRVWDMLAAGLAPLVS